MQIADLTTSKNALFQSKILMYSRTPFLRYQINVQVGKICQFLKFVYEGHELLSSDENVKNDQINHILIK